MQWTRAISAILYERTVYASRWPLQGEGRLARPPCGMRESGHIDMRVLFCGFDGVLHAQRATSVPFGVRPARLFEWLDVLEALLAPHDDAFVVVHSRWRSEWTDSELAMPLQRLGSRFLGSVPKGPRYASILQWLERNRSVSSYRILDDEAKEFPHPPPAQLVLCHPDTGIYDRRVRQQVREWLHGCEAAA